MTNSLKIGLFLLLLLTLSSGNTVSPVMGEAQPRSASSECINWDAARETVEAQSLGSDEWKRELNYAGSGMPQMWLGASSGVCGDVVEVHAAFNYPLKIEWWRIATYKGGSGRLIESFAGQPIVPVTVGAPDPSVDTLGLPPNSDKPRLSKSNTFDGKPAYFAASASRWPVTTAVTIPPGWPPGAYLVIARTSWGKGTAAPFLIRNESGPRKFMVVAPTTTWQAYNQWGASSLYSYPNKFGIRSENGFADAVTFNRPYYAVTGRYGPVHMFSAWSLLAHRLGTDYTWCADEDLVRCASSLVAPPTTVVLLAHDEYWTKSMRAVVDRWIAQGTNLVVLGGNTMYRYSRYDEISRTLFVRKKFNPLHKKDSAYLVSSAFDENGQRPQKDTIVLEAGCQTQYRDLKILNPRFWAWENQGLKKGTLFSRLLGYEVDTLNSADSLNSNKIMAAGRAECKDNKRGKKVFAHFVYSVNPKSNAGIINVGTTGWLSALPGIDRLCSDEAQLTNLKTKTFVLNTTIKVLGESMRGRLGRIHPLNRH